MIVSTLLDNDFSRFLLLQLVLNKYKDANVEYQMICRKAENTPTIDSRDIEDELNSITQLRMSEIELNYLKEKGIAEDTITYLRTYDPSRVSLRFCDSDYLVLSLSGHWRDVIPITTPIHATISQLYTDRFYHDRCIDIARSRLEAKIALLRAEDPEGEFQFVDLGTRRRHSSAWHREVIQRLCEELPIQFVGTGNTHYSRIFGIPTTGLMHHDLIQACQVLGPGTLKCQRIAFENWLAEYPNRYGIALSDTLGIQQFLMDFDADFARRFSGIRHDSGDPFHWGDAMIRHYLAHGIDPRQKILVFSDGLEMTQALRLFDYFRGRVGLSFGIGTSLTNDFGRAVPDSVVKIVKVNGIPVAKLTDDPTKNLHISSLTQLLEIQLTARQQNL